MAREELTIANNLQGFIHDGSLRSINEISNKNKQKQITVLNKQPGLAKSNWSLY